ncbi:hypothetical protein MMC25_001112 [Agyrium rufum]|nr:hypothetical protein [Agyrium rufum]
MAYTRSKTRERYNIDGSIVEDVLASWCCTLCVLTQEEKEVIEREKLLGSGTAAALQEPAGYQMQNGEQQGMKYEGPNGFA